MQIQMGKGVGLRRGEGVLASTAQDPVRAEMGLRRTSLAKNVIEEAARRDLLVGRAKVCGVCQNTWNSLAGESLFMPQR